MNFTGLIFIWDGWICKVHELLDGAYRITCLDWQPTHWLTADALLRILGMPPRP